MGRSPYAELASFYDLVYSGKSYAQEVRTLRGLARRFGPVGARRWLDVGCGTGEHLRFLAPHFEVEGIDASAAMLAVARKKLPKVRFRQARMESFRVDRPFDVVSCLFSAIGYLLDERSIARTFRAFRDALAPGGVVIVEPWLSPRTFRPGHIGFTYYRRADQLIARANTVERRGAITQMDLHYLLADRRGVRHVVERHRQRMTPDARLVELLENEGFHARFLARGLPLGRGALIGVRPAGASARAGGRRAFKANG